MHNNVSSAKRSLLRRTVRNSPSISAPLFSQFNIMLSGVAVNNFGEMLSPCLMPFLITIFSLSLSSCIAVTELSVYRSFRISMYTSSIPCSCNDVNIAWGRAESNALSYFTNEMHSRMFVFAALHFKLGYAMDGICRRILGPKSCSGSRFISTPFFV